MNKIMLLLISVVLFASCNEASVSDKEVKINDKSEVFYKDGKVTEADAKRLGDYLLANEYFDTTAHRSVHLTKGDSGYIIRCVVDKDKLKEDQGAELNFWVMQSNISDSVFKGQKTNIILTDNWFREIKSLASIERLKVNKTCSIVYSKDAFNSSTVQTLGNYLVEQGYFGDQQNDVFLTKDSSFNVIHLIVDKNAVEANFKDFLPVYERMGYLIRKNVFEGKDTKIVLTSPDFEDFESVPLVTSER